MNKDVRYLARWVLDIATPGGDHAVREVARRLLKEGRPSRQRKHLSPGKSREERREERNERAHEIREAVFARAGGRCECCRSRTPAEWHHLVSGGSRQHEESEETSAAVCTWCHVDLHKNKEHALLAMRRWAIEGQRTVALKAIEHRLAKLAEARGAPEEKP